MSLSENIGLPGDNLLTNVNQHYDGAGMIFHLAKREGFLLNRRMAAQEILMPGAPDIGNASNSGAISARHNHGTAIIFTGTAIESAQFGRRPVR